MEQPSKLISWMIIFAGHILCATVFGMLWNQSLALMGFPFISWWKSICLWSMFNLSIIVPFSICYSIHKANRDLQEELKNKKKE